MPNFKIYNQNQPMLLPLNIKDCIPKDHICFVINDAIEKLDITSIENTYSEKGSSAYSPRMVLKIMFYAYTQGVRSSRKIEAKLYEDCVFRFLSANQQPDHGTISLFRKKHLSDLENIFAQIVLLCEGLGMIDPANISIDGSKYKANASRNKTHALEDIVKLKKKIRQILKQAENIDQEENKKYGDKRGYNQMPERLIDPKTRQKEIEQLKQKLLKSDQAQNTIKTKQGNASTKKEKKLSKNTTYNFTDPDANLMPMKESKSFKPAFNGQIATSKQVIVSYDLTDDATDTNSLLPMIEKTEKITKKKVKTAKADSAYFSKNNIEGLVKKDIDAYIPDQRKTEEERQERENRIPKHDRRNFKYDPKKDEFICPQDKRLLYSNTSKGARRYICSECSNCFLRTKCAKDKNRQIQVDWKIEKYKQEMRLKLNSKKGKQKYLERFGDVEPVIGNIKSNQGMREFLCRGKPMALIEFGLTCTAHNLVKIFNYLKKTNNNLQNLQNLQLNTLTRVRAVT